jgi:hypothetical protein
LLKCLQAHELVPLAHVPGHIQQDARQHRQRNVQRQRRSQQHDGAQRGGVHDARDGRGGTGAQVGHRARNGARDRHATKERHDEIGDALRHQLLVGVVLAVVFARGELVGHARAQQRLDGAQQRDGERGNHQQAHSVP